MRQDQIVLSLQRCREIQLREATDLVDTRDYFLPIHDAYVQIGRKSVPRGEFMTWRNPRLRLVGNHIVRALLIRVALDHDALREVRNALQAERRSVANDLAERESASWNRLNVLMGELEENLLTSPAGKAHEACMVLVQVGAGNDGALATEWLGLPGEVLDKGRDLMDVRGMMSHFDTPEHIAEALNVVQRLLSDAPPSETAAEKAIRAGGLVILLSSQRVYWKSELLDVDWPKQRAAWEFLVLLTRRARLGQQVIANDLYPDEPPAVSTVYARAHRLARHLPGDLKRALVPGSEIASYRLDLEPSQIRILDTE